MRLYNSYCMFTASQQTRHAVEHEGWIHPGNGIFLLLCQLCRKPASLLAIFSYPPLMNVYYFGANFSPATCSSYGSKYIIKNPLGSTGSKSGKCLQFPLRFLHFLGFYVTFINSRNLNSVSIIFGSYF